MDEIADLRLKNAMEAIIAAVYLDQGLEAARQFITIAWADIIDEMVLPPKDAKSALQEWAQGRGLPLPEYEVIETTGPSHAPVFKVQVTVQGLEPKSATGGSKRIAEQEAAKLRLEGLEG